MSASEFINKIQDYVYVTKERCERSTLYGTYNGGTNKLVICWWDAANNGADRFETLKHEAVHAGQDCVTGKHTSSLDTMFDKEGLVRAARRHWRGVEDILAHSYNHKAYTHRWYIELEAWHLEYASNREVYNAIAANCPRINNYNKLTYWEFKYD